MKEKRKKQRKAAGISAKIISILDIYTMIAQKQYPTVRDFAEKCRVTERTVYRYLSIIGMVDPIEYDREHGGYTFTYGDRTKKLKLTEEELMILLATGQAVSQLGPSFRDSFQGIVNKMVARTGKAAPREKPPIVIKIPDALPGEKLDGHFKSISKCMTGHCSVELTYRARNTKEVTQRIVDPYGLVYYQGTWTLIAFCHLRRAIRIFALDRVIAVTERGLLFTPIEGFDLQQFLAQAWGIYHGKEVRVTVRFFPKVADYILRKDKWHPSEHREVMGDGSVLLSFRVMGLDELKGWIYSWIPNVEVVKPKWLRKRFSKELGETALRHG